MRNKEKDSIFNLSQKEICQVIGVNRNTYKDYEIAKYLNVDKSTYNKYENGKRKINNDVVKALAEYYSIKVSDIVD